MTEEAEITVTSCEECPCLGTNYDDESSCNNGYDTEFIIVKDREWVQVSANCKLVEIKDETGIWSPSKIQISNTKENRVVLKMETDYTQAFEDLIKRMEL